MALQTQGEDADYYILETSTQIRGAYVFLGINSVLFLLVTKKKLSDLYYMDYNKDLTSAFVATTVFCKTVIYHSCSASKLAFLLLLFF